MQVVHFHRRQGVKHYSIERLFGDIRSHLPSSINVKTFNCRNEAKGLFPRLLDAIRAARSQGDVNHITGDIHFLAIFFRKKRSILTIHDCRSLERLSGLRFYVYFFFWFWLPIRRVAVTTMISESTYIALSKYMQLDRYRIEVIPNCVSDSFRVVEAEDMGGRPPRLLQIGTNKNKNLEGVVKAISGLKCHLTIVGSLDSAQLELLEKSEISYKNLVNLTEPELLEEYARTDIVLFISLYEGFGLPILEAQAVGRPVITSDLEPMRTVIGRGGYVVDPYDPPSIRRLICSVVADPEGRANVINLGLQNVANYKTDYVAEKYADLYRELAGG